MLEEKQIQVCSAGIPEPYGYVIWGLEYRHQHDTALPELSRAALHFNLDPLALQYLLQCGGRDYFGTRVVQRCLDAGLLRRVDQSSEFSCLVYSRANRSGFPHDAISTPRAVVDDDIGGSGKYDAPGRRGPAFSRPRGCRGYGAKPA